MSHLKTFSETDFETGVLKSDKPVLVDFYADWCGPCKMMAPVVEQVAGEFGDRLTVGKLDVDASPDIAMRYQVMGIPTLGFFKAGKLVDKYVGYQGPSHLKSWVEKVLTQAAAA
jgi:thioredoxin 1